MPLPAHLRFLRAIRMSDAPQSPTPEPPEQPRQATLLEVIGAVFWSFFGVRKGKAMARDAVTMRPHQVIIVGVLAGAAFVVTLLLLVRLVLTLAGART
jgi:hypothetical protein